MELIEVLLSLAVLWRVLVGAAIGALAGAAVLAALPALGPGAVFGGAFLGSSAGVVWLTVAGQSAVAAPQGASSGSPVVLFGAVWALGVLWGSLLEAMLSVWLSAVVLALVTPLAAWLFCRVSGQTVAPAAQAAAVLALWLGLSFAHASGLSISGLTSNPSIERTGQRPLRALWPAAHVER